MTTIVAVKKNGVVAIAADSLTTFGDMRLGRQYKGEHDKIIAINGSWIGLCGSSAHHLVLSALLPRLEDIRLGSRMEVYDTFRRLHPLLKEQGYLNPKEEEDDPYESTQITALVVNATGIYGVYSMREVFEYSQFWAVGSGKEVALGAMYALYPRLRTAEAIAKAGIEAGATFDRNSALPMTLYAIRAR